MQGAAVGGYPKQTTPEWVGDAGRAQQVACLRKQGLALHVKGYQIMELWDQVQRRLELELGKETVDQWIRPLKVDHFDAGNLYLEAQDTFQIAWFEEHARPFCTKLLNENGRPVKIHLSTPAAAKPSVQRPVPPPFSVSPDPLDPDLTLPHFLHTRSSNQVAWRLVGEAAAKSPFNPVLFYGPPGSGKTHLLMAACALLKEKGLNPFYVRASTFTEHIVQAFRTGNLRAVRSAYRSAGALLVDDIDVFSKKGATQEEFFHTFNELHTRGCPIFLSSQFPPSKMTEIEPRLVSRFEWGISVGLEKEDWIPILELKSRLWKLSLDPDLIPYLASRFPSSPLLALQALALRAKDAPRITPKLADLLLKDLLQNETRVTVTPDKIIKALAAYFGIQSADILGKAQTREVALPRQMAMYLCRHKLKLPFQKIGEIFGRDHSTVMSSVKQIQESIDKPEMASAFSTIDHSLSV